MSKHNEVYPSAVALSSVKIRPSLNAFLISSLVDLIDELGWDYQRMSVSGREIYDNICHLLNAIPENEVYMEI